MTEKVIITNIFEQGIELYKKRIERYNKKLNEMDSNDNYDPDEMIDYLEKLRIAEVRLKFCKLRKIGLEGKNND